METNQAINGQGEHIIELSEAIYETFKTGHGRSVLGWILDQCGYFETKPENIKPELIALANRIIRTGNMTIEGNMGRFMDAIIDSYEKEEKRV